VNGTDSVIPPDYEERVYAGVLGKLIGVYLGRPIEGWTYERITRELGEVGAYVNAHPRVVKRLPLVVTDDDITGTFTFLRALPDYGNARNLTPAQIGQTWLNYLIERTTILWWGGMGNSTEHTAYVRLRNGIAAPHSGSAALNGQVVAEQIGAQIFIDGWAMVAPGDPQLAADLARRAASVSHDGAAVHAAMLLAAMEAQAFVERAMDRLLEVGLACIPRGSLIARLVGDVRAWAVQDEDWRRTRERIEQTYGYDRYGGGCHVVPNHALVILALVYAPDDFQRALLIANTSGWDTDCNSGNVGCLLGIKNGLAGIDGSPVDWRGPIADRLYLPTADGGRCITDAVRETYRVTRIGRALKGSPPVEPKLGARFHFELPGSVQGFEAAGARIENVPSYSVAGKRSLAIHVDAQAELSTPTFVTPDALSMPGYALVASPTLYPGQEIRASVMSDVPTRAGLIVDVYGANDQLERKSAGWTMLKAGERSTLRYMPDVDGGSPIARVGLRVGAERPGPLYLDWLTWSGAPAVSFSRPAHGGTMWQRAWVKACDDVRFGRSHAIRICQDGENGLLIQGEREWENYAVKATIFPHLAREAGIAACVQGTRRYVALLLCDDGCVRLVKALDGRRVLAEAPFAWTLDAAYDLRLETRGDRLLAFVDGRLLFDVHDSDGPLLSGAVALVIDSGRLDCDGVSISPLGKN
jgi:ADP-ribosylglycohydrolase